MHGLRCSMTWQTSQATNGRSAARSSDLRGAATETKAMRRIPLTNSKKMAMVDDQDYERISKHQWALEEDTGFVVRYEHGNRILMHYEVLGLLTPRKLGLN
jgi:hypothetical protein